MQLIGARLAKWPFLSYSFIIRNQFAGEQHYETN